MEQKFRTETDSMGAINVPYDNTGERKHKDL